MTAPTPSRPTKWPGCTATWTSSIRAGSLQRNRLLLQLPPRLWLGPPPLSPWSGFRPSTDTSLKGDHVLLCTLALNRMERSEIGEQPGAPLQEHSFNTCDTQSGLRLFPKFIHIEEVIDLFSALPFSACSTLLRAIDLPCKGQIFFHMLWEEFSINDSGPVIPVRSCYCSSQIPMASALPARSPSSSCMFLMQGQGESCFYSHDSTELVGRGVSQGEEVAGPGRGTNAASFPELQVWDGSWARESQRPKTLSIVQVSSCCTLSRACRSEYVCVFVSDRHAATWYQ